MREGGTIVALGNCQVKGVAVCAGAILGWSVDYFHPSRLKSEPAAFDLALGTASIVLAGQGGQSAQANAGLVRAGSASRVLAVPRLFFSGFHPDAVYPATQSAERRNPLGNVNSAILLAAWREGLTATEAIGLFRGEVYAELGYFDVFPQASRILIDECANAGYDAGDLLNRWRANGVFMHQPLHPMAHVMSDIAHLMLVGAGMASTDRVTPTVDDELARNAIWPVYPEIARHLGIVGDYIFSPKNLRQLDHPDLAPMNLENFVVRSYEVFEATPPELRGFARLSDERLANIGRFVRRASSVVSNANPYKNLADFHWWSKAVVAPEYADVDPVVEPKFKIARDDRIATAGSCFAQHIAKRLHRSGYNYLVTEEPPKDLLNPAQEDYGVFSARFGNVYTTRQMVQLIQRAYGLFTPVIDRWVLDDGALVDPFRPRIGSQPFATEEELLASREVHLAAVREMVEKLDVFVFTLGLTEAWQAREDGAVVPLAPGTLSAAVPANAYEPHNFSVAEVSADLDKLVSLIRRFNPDARIVLTVSPVPLIATFENEHVLTATTYSKSVLRVAAGEAARGYHHVAYFPSFEIITGNFNRGRYFADDLREVREEGVNHVMRLFMHHYTEGGIELTIDPIMEDMKAGMDIICDEEEIARSVQH